MWYHRFLAWLEVRPSGRETIRLIFGMFAFKFVWSIVAGFLIASIAVAFGDDLANRATDHPLLNEMLRGQTITAVSVIFLLIVGEEFFFRFVPFTVVLSLIHFWPRMRHLVVPTILVTGIAFGLLHVANFKEMTALAVATALLMQGVAGVLLGILFVKSTGLKVQFANRAYFVTTFAHVLWNAILITIAHAT